MCKHGDQNGQRRGLTTHTLCWYGNCTFVNFQFLAVGNRILVAKMQSFRCRVIFSVLNADQNLIFASDVYPTRTSVSFNKSLQTRHFQKLNKIGSESH